MKIGAIERKILIIICYYVLLGVVALTAFTQNLRTNTEFADELRKYFVCESKGIDPNSPEACDRSGFERHQMPALTALAFILLALFPAVNLIFAVNSRELKQFCSHFSRTRFDSNWVKQPNFSNGLTTQSQPL